MGAEQPSLIQMLLPFVLMIPIFYFLVIRPQGQKTKKHDDFLNNLKRGDEVVLASGFLGRIEGLTEKVVTIDLGEGQRVKVLKRQIAGSQQAFLRDEPNGASGASSSPTVVKK